MKITQRFFIPLFLSLASCGLAGEVSQNLQDGVVFVNEDAGGAIIQNKKINTPTYIKQNDNLIKETFKRDDDFSKGWNRTKNGVNTPVVVDILCNVSRGRVMEWFPKEK